MLPIKLFQLVFCLFRFIQSIESFCFGKEANKPKQTVSKQTKTQKLAVLVHKRNNLNKHFVSDSAETSFGSSLDCFESKLVLKDTELSGRQQGEH
jgi:hypothetical protein